MRPAERLRAGSVLVAGVGALGCAAADVLVEAGVGRLGLVDPDVVELSNLHRQLLHRTADLGTPKVDSAARRLAAGHPRLRLDRFHERLDLGSAARLLPAYDCVIDATDGVATKFAINDLAVRFRRPLVHAGIVRFVGQLFTILPGETACYRCLFERPPDARDVPSCQEAGVLGSLPGTIGALQAAQAIRLLTGTGALLTDRLLTYDALAGHWRHVRLGRNPACAVCGAPPALATAPGSVYEQATR